jgi:hypothetical protein
MKYLLVIPVAVLLAACSSKNDVAMNTDYQWSKSHAEQKRLEAISEIAKQGESGVVAAALLMQQNGQYNAAPPRTGGDRAVDLAKTIMPALGNTLIGVGQIGATVYAAEVQKDIAINNSNNNKEVAINSSNNDTTVATHTNDTMAGIAEVTIVNPEVVNPEVVNNTTICVSDATYTCE